MSYRFRFFILYVLGIFYSQQIFAVSSCLEAFNGGLKARILNNNRSVREEFVGMDGYALFSEKDMDGKMKKAFINVSSVLDKAEFERLGWQQFQGTVPEFRVFRNKILNKDGSVREEFAGMEGYAFFAEKEIEGKMQKAFQNVSSVLDKAEFERLGWQQFQGTVPEFRAFRNKILNNNGSVREEYVGMEGYAFFAEKETEGKMQKAFQNVSSVLDKAEFERLGWQGFRGTVSEFRAFRNKILNKDGSVREGFAGMEGYAFFAEDRTEGNMPKAFQNVSSVLGKLEFAKLVWQQFQGTVPEFRAFRNKILNNNGSVREEYVGMDGYALFSEKETEGKMQKAFQNVSSVLDKAEFERLGWQQFQGTVPEFRVFRNKILNKERSVREGFAGMGGYALFSEKEAEGKMQKAFKNVSAVLNKAEFERLGWQHFQGTVSEFRAFRNKILNKDGSVREEFAGMEGYAFFAEDRTEGNMQKAFQNVSSVLDKAEFERLGWQGFQGTVSEFRALRNKILKGNGNVKEEYVGMDGYALFSERYMEGKIQKAFQNVSSVLDKAEFAKLDWQQFQGTVSEFRAFRNKILNQEGSVRGEYVGMEGYVLFSEQETAGKMLKAFINVSSALDKAEFADLDWQHFQGTAIQFHALLEDFIENYPEGYKGLRGQQRVADQIFKGDRLKTYRNVSVLRGYFFGEGKGKDGRIIKHREFRALDWIRQ